jgi:hypothetical protein
MRRAGILLTGRGFNGLAAAGVKLKEVLHLILGLGGRGETESGGRGGGTAYVGVASDKFEQIESDIFGAAGGGERSGFHGSMVAGGEWRRKSPGMKSSCIEGPLRGAGCGLSGLRETAYSLDFQYGKGDFAWGTWCARPLSVVPAWGEKSLL